QVLTVHPTPHAVRSTSGACMSNRSFFATIPWVARIAAALGLALALLHAAWGQHMVEGKSYVQLKIPQNVETGNNIEFIEFFSYGCPHCGELEPVLQGWLKSKPADVTFRRSPVMVQLRWGNLDKGS